MFTLSQTHEVFAAAHTIARKSNTAEKYQTRFNKALRSLYRAVAHNPAKGVAVRALARTEKRRLDRQENLIVGEFQVQGGRISAAVFNPMTEQTYRTTILFAKDKGGFHCTCLDHQYRAKQIGPCKHVAALATAHLTRKDNHDA